MNELAYLIRLVNLRERHLRLRGVLVLELRRELRRSGKRLMIEGEEIEDPKFFFKKI